MRILLIALSLLVGVEAFSQTLRRAPWSKRVVNTGPTLQEDLGSAGGSSKNVGITSGLTYRSSQFTASGSYTLTRVDVSLKSNNNPTMNLTCEIWSDDGSNSPSASLQAATATLDTSTLTASFADYTYNFSGLSITSGTKYHIVLYVDATNGSNYPVWEFLSSGGRTEISSDGLSWTFDNSWVGTAQVWGN